MPSFSMCSSGWNDVTDFLWAALPWHLHHHQQRGLSWLLLLRRHRCHHLPLRLLHGFSYWGEPDVHSSAKHAAPIHSVDHPLHSLSRPGGRLECGLGEGHCEFTDVKLSAADQFWAVVNLWVGDGTVGLLSYAYAGQWNLFFFFGGGGYIYAIIWWNLFLYAFVLQQSQSSVPLKTVTRGVFTFKPAMEGLGVGNFSRWFK